MAGFMRYLIPQKLKYRLFMAFVCLILLPFCALNWYNYQRIETLVQQKSASKATPNWSRCTGPWRIRWASPSRR